MTDPANLKDALLGAMFDDNSQSDQKVDYAADVKPWLGSSAAVAVFVDANQQPQSVGILQVTDAAKAKASLAKLVTTRVGYSITGYTVEGDYVVSATVKPLSTQRLRMRRSLTSTPTPPTPPTSRC